MKTVREMLRDADPVRAEHGSHDADRDWRRQAIVAAAAAASAPPAPWFHRRAVIAVAAAIVVGIVAVGSQIWPRGGATLQAAVRFEVRLAEAQPAADLLEARVAGSAKVLYLHREIIVTNDDIARSRVVQGDGPSRFGIGVEFTPSGAEKMLQATAGHIGSPVAIIIDGNVVMAPVLRSPISASAVISGDFTQAEAERIVNGIIKN